MINKKGAIGFSWIIVIIFLFLLGLAYIVYNQVLTVHISPVAGDLIDDSPYINASQKLEMKEHNAKYMSFWNSMPFILVFLMIIYLITRGFTKGDQNV
jgi:hypothetical protein